MSIPPKFRRNAAKYTEHLSSLLTKTVTDQPLKALNAPPNGARIAFRDGGELGGRRSVELANGLWIRVFQLIRPNPGDGSKVQTAEYSYVYASSADADNDWLVRYDYVPEEASSPGYRYPVAHVHFNGYSEKYERLAIPGKKPLEKLHFPTRRISLEDFIEHLIIEFAVPTRSDPEEALELLSDSREGFDYRRTR